MDDHLPPDRSQRAHRRLTAGVAAVVVAIVAVAIAAAGGRSDARSRYDDPTFAVRAARSTAPGSSTTTTAAVTTTAPPALLQPEDPPEDARADVPVTHVGEIEIPKIGLRHPVFEGIWLTVIDHGPGHWPGTPRPGGYGNVVFAGHRVTHSHPFRQIDQLVAGDTVIFRMDDGGVFTYRVTGSEVVVPSATRIVDQHPGHTLTLFACHPPGSASHRYVVHAELESTPSA